MKLITTLVLVLALGACANEPEITESDELAASIAWNVHMDQEARDVMCQAYYTTEKDVIIGYLTSDPDPVSSGEAEAFYSVMNEEC